MNRDSHSARWSAEKARSWSKACGWQLGCNYTPAYAANQIEFWAKSHFDASAIAQELDLARDCSFTLLRVYAHDLLYAHEGTVFFDRFEQFLEIAAARGLRVMPVLFDSVWNPDPAYAPQAEPRKGVHNAAWLQSPGLAILRDNARFAGLETYVRAFTRRFRTDERILIWDVWNEPDNPNTRAYGEQDLPVHAKAKVVAPLLETVFAWMRAENPLQPLTSGVWMGADAKRLIEKPLPSEEVQLALSDVITFHNYGPPDELCALIEALTRCGRPMLCTEFMARPLGSTLQACLPVLKRQGIGAISWGFVQGRTQTHLPWESWTSPAVSEPELWFHDLYRTNGTPYDAAEIAFLKSLNQSD